jgi:uncharacterized 2Fe-2S/4Fe-4S cluster protein (DUF4445 family)
LDASTGELADNEKSDAIRKAAGWSRTLAYVAGFARIGALICEQARCRGMPDKNQKRSTLVPDRQVRVTFQPCGRAVFVLPETTILEAAACAGLTIDTPCGGMGTCGKCRVQVISGACEPTEADRQVFSEAELRNGWRLSCGMRAAGGAIEKVVFDGDIQSGIIGDGPPIGLCGSGLIDVGAELLKHGMVSPEGRLLPPEELPPALSPHLKRRVLCDSNGITQFLLADRGPKETDPPVVLTQRDVRELQLACGAIRAGINILLKHARLQTANLRSVLIGGGFRSFIRRKNAQRIGLLPEDLDHRRVHYVGNVSLAGAKWVVLSTEARGQAEELAQQTHLVQLSTDKEFPTAFAEAMIFPRNHPEGRGTATASRWREE